MSKKPTSQKGSRIAQDNPAPESTPTGESVWVDSKLLRPVVVSCPVVDPVTLETEQVSVRFWPGRYQMNKAHVEAALASDWLADFCAAQQVGGEVSDYFVVKAVD